MGEALYRKHRPKRLSDVVGQPHITKTLQNALKTGRVSHGYLFSGPRGVGKTSIARILAHEVNGFEYGKEQGSLDIIEIDAASNRRIDEIREIRDKIHTLPVNGKYKVYIIDEVHMLTREAFNALLKTLEEPPAHVIFILATTEVHKVPDTIISRTQRYTFKPIGPDAVSKHLQQLAKQENIIVSNDALSLIAEHGGGSFRDSISLLDQLSADGKIDETTVEQALGVPDNDTISKLITVVRDGDLSQLITLLDNAEDSGYSPNKISQSLIKHLRNALIQGEQLFGNDTVQTMERLLQIATTRDQRASLELLLVDISLHNAPKRQQTTAEDDQKQTTNFSKPVAKPEVKSKVSKAATKTKASKVTPETTGTQTTRPLSDDTWESVLTRLKQKNNTLYGIARMAQPIIGTNEITLKVPFKFHHKRLTDEKNAPIIHATIAEIVGDSVTITVIVDEALATGSKKTEHNKKSESATLESITQIFGGGEVLDT